MAEVISKGAPTQVVVIRDGWLSDDVVAGDYLIAFGRKFQKMKDGDTVYSGIAAKAMSRGTPVHVLSNWAVVPRHAD